MITLNIVMVTKITFEKIEIDLEEGVIYLAFNQLSFKPCTPTLL